MHWVTTREVLDKCACALAAASSSAAAYIWTFCGSVPVLIVHQTALTHLYGVLARGGVRVQARACITRIKS